MSSSDLIPPDEFAALFNELRLLLLPAASYYLSCFQDVHDLDEGNATFKCAQLPSALPRNENNE